MSVSLSYEMLDAIADTYIPLLALISIFLLVRLGMHRDWRMLARQLGGLIFSLLCAYGLMLVDFLLTIWAHVGMDYSTHTAVALVFVIHLTMWWKRMWRLWWLSFLGYLALMFYQQYHTVADMFSTGVVICMLFVPLLRYAVKTRLDADTKAKGRRADLVYRAGP
ncbi:peptidase S24, LexA repressor [Oleiphilus messinensis]|uniref:Peptidase S24, LexA repressor n=1 Tax=Oleiphilus messinensis TaxID=141451 RepID=A0A1Y0I8J9_9GAMM|nr:hypothetical protein [Oleiphilus messinensis]ARU56096.1 peptidase S24, LexA repressor [Oleiphilus messinensis]